MFLGGNTLIPDEDVVCILPRETTLTSREARRALDAAIGAGRADESAGGTESYVLCARNGRQSVYASPISSKRLVERNQRAFKEDR